MRIVLSLRLLRPVDVFYSTSAFLSLPVTDASRPRCDHRLPYLPFHRRIHLCPLPTALYRLFRATTSASTANPYCHKPLPHATLLTASLAAGVYTTAHLIPLCRSVSSSPTPCGNKPPCWIFTDPKYLIDDPRNESMRLQMCPGYGCVCKEETLQFFSVPVTGSHGSACLVLIPYHRRLCSYYGARI
jgi:hypothetical protein